MINMRRVVHNQDVSCMRSAKTRLDEMVSSQCKCCCNLIHKKTMSARF